MEPKIPLLRCHWWRLVSHWVAWILKPHCHLPFKESWILVRPQNNSSVGQESWQDTVMHQSNGFSRLLGSLRNGHDEFWSFRHGRSTGPLHFFHRHDKHITGCQRRHGRIRCRWGHFANFRLCLHLCAFVLTPYFKMRRIFDHTGNSTPGDRKCRSEAAEST